MGHAVLAVQGRRERTTLNLCPSWLHVGGEPRQFGMMPFGWSIRPGMQAGVPRNEAKRPPRPRERVKESSRAGRVQLRSSSPPQHAHPPLQRALDLTGELLEVTSTLTVPVQRWWDPEQGHLLSVAASTRYLPRSHLSFSPSSKLDRFHSGCLGQVIYQLNNYFSVRDFVSLQPQCELQRCSPP